MSDRCSECEGMGKIQVQCENCKYSNVDCCTRYEVWCYDTPCPICHSKEYEQAIKGEKASPAKAILKNLAKLGVTDESFEGKLVKEILGI